MIYSQLRFTSEARCKQGLFFGIFLYWIWIIYSVRTLKVLLNGFNPLLSLASNRTDKLVEDKGFHF